MKQPIPKILVLGHSVDDEAGAVFSLQEESPSFVFPDGSHAGQWDRPFAGKTECRPAPILPRHLRAVEGIDGKKGGYEKGQAQAEKKKEEEARDNRHLIGKEKDICAQDEDGEKSDQALDPDAA